MTQTIEPRSATGALLLTAGLVLTLGMMTSCGGGGAATCGANDLNCFMEHLEVSDESGNHIHIDFIATTVIADLSSATSSLANSPYLTAGPTSLLYPYGSMITGVDVTLPANFDLEYADPNACRPVMCFGLSKGGTKSKNSGCWGGASDGLLTGSFYQSVGWRAEAPDGADFDFDMTPISSESCTNIDNPINLITADGAYPLGGAGIAPGVTAGNTISIPIRIAPPPGNTTDTSGSSCTAAWDCGSSAQCASVMGGTSGTAGPFGSLAECNAWRTTYFAGAVCSAGCH